MDVFVLMGSDSSNFRICFLQYCICCIIAFLYLPIYREGSFCFIIIFIFFFGVLIFHIFSKKKIVPFEFVTLGAKHFWIQLA